MQFIQAEEGKDYYFRWWCKKSFLNPGGVLAAFPPEDWARAVRNLSPAKPKSGSDAGGRGD